MEDLLWNSIRLHSKWSRIRKDRFYIRDYLSKHPEEMENHIREIESYEIEVLKTPLYESDKKTHLRIIREYKDELKPYQNNSGIKSLQYSTELVYFLLFLCLGSVLTLVGNEYLEKSRLAQEKGFREGFNQVLNKVLKKHGVSYGTS